MISELVTERLLLRRWRDEDREPFFRMCQDAEVMRYLLPVADRAASDALVDRIDAHFYTNGFGRWVAERRNTGEFIGTIGLLIPRVTFAFSPCVEVGWRLTRAAWGNGFASEGAAAAMKAGFEQLGLTEIVSMTALQNERSWRVMERLGMRRDAETFAHPALVADHPLSEHFLYRASGVGRALPAS